METPEIDANSGVEALLGFEFQRNCALMLILDNYSDFDGQNYFLSIEHYDDFLFCFRNPNTLNVAHIKSYQAKKLSGNKWTINQRLLETINKMLDVGKALSNDPIPKEPDYKKELLFVSNSPIELKSNNLNLGKKGLKPKYETVTLKENANMISFSDLPLVIQKKIKESINSQVSEDDSDYKDLKFNFIELPKTAKLQKTILIGLMNQNFKEIPDSAAAIEVLLCLFREIETVYNQKNKISLMDQSKTLEGTKIANTISLIKLEKRTFTFWRENSREFCKTLRISRGEAEKAEEYIGIAFELFKDKQQTEHKKLPDYP